MTCRIAVISDIHSTESCVIPARKGQHGPTFLLRTVHRLNRWIRPDIVVVLGDLIDKPDEADALDRLTELKQALDLLQCPYVVIPGNHDPSPEVFYSVMPKPAPVIDIGRVRFLPFVDAEAPGYNAHRSDEDMRRLRSARGGHDGPIVALQHVPVLPPGESKCPYNYVNVDAIMAAMEDQGVTLAIGGHYHKGTPLIRRGKCAYLAVQALCEAPFVFTMITLDEDRIDVTPHALQMPPELGLMDYHLHTPFAYCSRGMDMAVSIELAATLGLAGLVFTEHSGQLYFERQTYWRGTFCREGVNHAQGVDLRVESYWQAAELVRSDRVRARAGLSQPVFVGAGLEVDADFSGNPVVRPEDRARATLLNGAVHHLSELQRERPDYERVVDEFLAVTHGLVRSGIQILAHPFRVFRRAKLTVPTQAFDPVVRMLKENGVAAEINFHTNTPDPDFLRRCLDAGVKITFGSDAHEQWEVGEFAPHLALLREVGYGGDLGDILATPVKRDAGTTAC